MNTKIRPFESKLLTDIYATHMHFFDTLDEANEPIYYMHCMPPAIRTQVEEEYRIHCETPGTVICDFIHPFIDESRPDWVLRN